MKQIFLIVLLIPSLIISQDKMFDKPLSNRIANYKIECRFDPETKIITGSEKLTWKNITDENVSELQFHLYMNAFRDLNSTFFTESEAVPYFMDNNKINWGYCVVNKIVLNGSQDLTGKIKYIHPDDDNELDRTVITVELPQELKTGGVINLKIDFETKLPRCVSRCGYNGNFFFAGQWYPKIGVYENGKWNCHQFHFNTEFYADFGIYDVKITLPRNLVVGATGVLVDTKNLGDGLKQLHYYCEDVHDFAWAADDDFIEKKTRHKGINIRLLCQPENLKYADDYIKAAKMGIDFYGKTYGEYPYPVLTIVDPQDINASDMEYPTLYTGSATAFEPEGEQYSYWVNIHEFGHNYFQGMVASNEFEDVWLDEGINTYAGGRAFEEEFGKFYFISDSQKVTLRDFRRRGYINYAEAGTVLQPAWTYRTRNEYFALTYTKPEMMLYTLENYFGTEIWNKVMRTYFQRWKFKHPKTENFIELVYEVTGTNMRFFLEQFLKTNHTVDFLVQEVRGTNKVIVKRDGNLMFPVKITIKFSDGSEVKKEWNAKKKHILYEFDNSKEITSVQIDPDNILEFELNKNNNVWTKN